MSDLRTRIATIVHDKDTVKCCDECTISSPGPWDYEVADAIIEALKADYVIVDTALACNDQFRTISAAVARGELRKAAGMPTKRKTQQARDSE